MEIHCILFFFLSQFNLAKFMENQSNESHSSWQNPFLYAGSGFVSSPMNSWLIQLNQAEGNHMKLMEKCEKSMIQMKII